jgi:hypothetical protein
MRLNKPAIPPRIFTPASGRRSFCDRTEVVGISGMYTRDSGGNYER